jgi:hypothetical protein
MRSISLCGLDHKQTLQASAAGSSRASARRRCDCENPYFTGSKRIQISRDTSETMSRAMNRFMYRDDLAVARQRNWAGNCGNRRCRIRAAFATRERQIGVEAYVPSAMGFDPRKLLWAK